MASNIMQFLYRWFHIIYGRGFLFMTRADLS